MKEKWKYIKISILLVIIIPFIIDSCYKIGDKMKYSYNTLFSASDVLTFYGAILAGALTIAGVFLTVRYSQKEYKQDMINRVLPFLTVNALSNSYYSNVFEDLLSNPANEAKATAKYEIYETDFKSIYFVISNKIEVEYSLSDLDKKSFMMSTDTVYKNSIITLVSTYKSYKAIHIINSGNGPAVNLSISLSKSDEKDSEVSAIAISLHVGEKIYLAFCLNNMNNIASGDYVLHYNYKDIYQNEYDKYQNLSFTEKGGIIDLEIK